jgi:hypothetical protein
MKRRTKRSLKTRRNLGRTPRPLRCAAAFFFGMRSGTKHLNHPPQFAERTMDRLAESIELPAIFDTQLLGCASLAKNSRGVAACRYCFSGCSAKN